MFSANHGGISADSSEVWGNPITYLKSVSSPWDSTEQILNEPIWYQVELASGTIGYMLYDLLTLTGQTNSSGLSVAARWPLP